MGGLAELAWRLTLTPSEDLRSDESDEVMRRLAQFGSQAELEDSSTGVAHEGEHVVTVGLQLRSGDARFPPEILSPLEDIIRFLGSRGYRWFLWIDAYVRSSSYYTRRDDIDPRPALLRLSEDWDSGGSGPKRWIANDWSPVDLGSTRSVEPKAGVLLVDYQPGPLNYTDAAVPTSEILSMFGSVHVETGRLSPPPRRWSGKGGAAPPGPIEINLALVAAAGAAAYASAILAAAGKDSWEALKRGIQNLRKHPQREVQGATVSIALRVGSGWILLQGPSIDADALAALDSVSLPALPTTDFEWVLEWESARRRWVLLPDRYMPGNE
jgi:hypothetical protein